MSRNRSRTGLEHETKDAQAPIPQVTAAATQDEGNPFSFVVPTEFVELPSKGKFYPENHPLHEQETIEIKQMTAKEEDILTSRSLLKKGIAVERVLHSLMVDKRVDPESLIVGDRNAIIIAARVSGYGHEYTTKIACPACSAQQQYTFDLNDAVITSGQSAEVTPNGDGTYSVLLPKTKLTATFRVLTGRDEKRLTASVEKSRKSNKADKIITSQLKNIICAVNGNDTEEAISYVADNLPSMDSAYLRKAYRLTAPDVDLSQHFDCIACDHSQEMEVPLTADFFWPDI